jgi:hypothetical protein
MLICSDFRAPLEKRDSGFIHLTNASRIVLPRIPLGKLEDEI